MREPDVSSQCVDATKLNFIKRSRPGNEFRFFAGDQLVTSQTQEITRYKQVHPDEER